MKPDKRSDYWSKHIRLLLPMLLVWFVLCFVLPLFLADSLNTIRIGGYGLGFLFMAQGSILLLIALLFYHASRMDKLDRKYRNPE